MNIKLSIMPSFNLAMTFLAIVVASQLAVAQEISSNHKIKPVESIKTIPSRIAFGSCAKETKKQPILRTIIDHKPDLFVYLGDNIYGDTKDIKILAKKYSTLGNKPEFQSLAEAVPLLSVWDDHDYGWNDAGKEYALKAESKELFMEFWQVPVASQRRQHEGIYGAHSFSDGKHKLQIILLDTRTFRDLLKRNSKADLETKGKEAARWMNEYQPDSSPEKTLLGEEQWKWLETVLAEPADLRIVCSSIQFGHEYNGWESWNNLPREQTRMIDLIKSTKANGVVFISGDVHWGEINRRDVGTYPLFDITASGLTEQWYNVEPSKFRVGEAVRENHFGMIQIDWTKETPYVVMQVIDRDGVVRVANSVPLNSLQFSPATD